jgi:DNA-binding MarR family transcriptional regulator/N-acetylglutamate synthase-like GNAT family acetyltransferase
MSTASRRVAEVRRFNRFYTRRIGALDKGHLGSAFSLAEVRTLYELALRGRTTATELIQALAADPGYVSRIVKNLERLQLLERTRSNTDARRSELTLTRKGRQALAPLDRRASEQIAAMLAPLGDPEQRRLLEAMRTLEALLGAPDRPAAPYLLREPRVGDLGFIVHRQAVLYAAEYGWDQRYEALISKLVGTFLERFNPRRERCWVAERHGEIAGSVFVMEKSRTIAQLRLLYVEPGARGLGIGRRLVDECIRFAREKEYRTLRLWTNSVLRSARRLYQAAEFQLVEEEPHHSFGKDLVGQYWELRL